MSLILAGLALLAPRTSLHALSAVCRIAASRLVVPAALGTGVIIAAHTGVGDAPPAMRAAVVSCWWIALALGALQTCRAIAAAGSLLDPPGPSRLRLGTTILIGGSTANAAALLGVFHHAGYELSATATGLALLGLLVAFVLILRDTHHLTAHE